MKKRVVDYLRIIAGTLIIAISFNTLLLPNKIPGGGIGGISTILYELFGFTPAIVQYAIAIPLLVLGTLVFGFGFGAKTLLGTILLPGFVYLTSSFPIFTSNPILAVIFGGVLNGIGLGIVFSGNASTGGIDIIARMIHKYLHLPLGLSVGLIDGLIVFTAMIFINVEAGMYSLIAIVLTSRVIDIVQTGLDHSKTVFIISDKKADITNQVLYSLDKGLSKIEVTGGHSGKKQEMIFCVIKERDFFKLKQLVMALDENAFVVAMSATEVMGKGFTLNRRVE